MTSKSYTKNPQSVNKFNVDRGVDLDTGRYWARYGDLYASFRTASERDQWLARWDLPAVLAIAATGEKTAYTAQTEMARAFEAWKVTARAWFHHPRGANLNHLSWNMRNAEIKFQDAALAYAPFAGRM